jgi:hypothetical protein
VEVGPAAVEVVTATEVGPAAVEVVTATEVGPAAVEVVTATEVGLAAVEVGQTTIEEFLVVPAKDHTAVCSRVRVVKKKPKALLPTLQVQRSKLLRNLQRKYLKRKL